VGGGGAVVWRGIVTGKRREERKNPEKKKSHKLKFAEKGFVIKRKAEIKGSAIQGERLM